MAPHSSTVARKIPWMEEPGRLQPMGSLRVRHDWVTSLSLSTFMHWRRKWQPTPVFLPGESQGRRSPVGYSPWGRTELDLTERLHFTSRIGKRYSCGSMEKNLPAQQETWVRSLGQGDPLEKEIAMHCNILAWKIPWTEEPGRLESIGLHRVRHDWMTKQQQHRTGTETIV